MFNKITKILKSKKGLTMVEMLCAMAISAIILTAVIGVIVPTARTAAYNNKLAIAKSATSNALNYIENELMYATSIKISGGYDPAVLGEAIGTYDIDPDPSHDEDICSFKYDDSTATFAPIDIYTNGDDKYLLKYTVHFNRVKDSTGAFVDNLLSIKFKAYDKNTDEEIYNCESVVETLNPCAIEYANIANYDDDGDNPLERHSVIHVVTPTGLGNFATGDPGMGGAAAWDPTRVYYAGDVVSHNGNTYVYYSATNAAHKEPGVDVNFWDIWIVAGSTSEYDPSAHYNRGDLVMFGGSQYVKISTANDKAPDEAGHWAPINIIYS